MILVDTSVWVDHFRTGDPRLAELLASGAVLSHAFVVGELALGNLRQRGLILDALADLPQAVVASHEEALRLVEAANLHGRGIGYVDTHLLASVRLTAGTLLWTRDKRLAAIATELGVEAAV